LFIELLYKSSVTVSIMISITRKTELLVVWCYVTVSYVINIYIYIYIYITAACFLCVYCTCFDFSSRSCASLNLVIVSTLYIIYYYPLSIATYTKCNRIMLACSICLTERQTERQTDRTLDRYNVRRKDRQTDRWTEC